MNFIGAGNNRLRKADFLYLFIFCPFLRVIVQLVQLATKNWYLTIRKTDKFWSEIISNRHWWRWMKTESKIASWTQGQKMLLTMSIHLIKLIEICFHLTLYFHNAALIIFDKKTSSFGFGWFNCDVQSSVFIRPLLISLYTAICSSYKILYYKIYYGDVSFYLSATSSHKSANICMLSGRQP